MRATTLLMACALSASAGFAGDGADQCLELGAARSTSYIVTHDGTSTMCGELGDIALDSKDRATGGDAIWFKIDDQTWVVRDPGLATEAGRLFRDVEELGAKQGALGAKQGRIGAEQGRIGAEQGRLAAKHTANALRDGDAQIPEAYEARMRELGERQSALGREQAAYGEQQSKLGEQMTEAVAEAQRGLSELLKRAMKNGAAVRVTRL